MPRNNKLFLLSTLIVAALGLPASSHAANKTVALLAPEQSVEYWALYDKAFRDAATQAGLTVDVKTNDFAAADQATQVEQTLAQRPDAIVLVPVDSSALLPSIRKISRAGIPLVISNSMPSAKYSHFWNVFTGPDDVGNGVSAAQAMIQGFREKGFGETGTVFVIDGVLGTPPQIQRYQGFVDTLKREAPGIKVVGALPGDWDAVKAEAAASALFTQHKDVRGVYAEYDVMLQGVVTAAQRLGLDPSKLVLVGHGCDAPGVAAVESGKAYATIEQSPLDDGAYAARAAAALLAGTKPATVEFLPHPVATKANLTTCYAYKAQ